MYVHMHIYIRSYVHMYNVIEVHGSCAGQGAYNYGGHAVTAVMSLLPAGYSSY